MPDASLQWDSIKDFSPGIHQVLSPNHAPGTAQMEGTYRCYALDGGALGPLPKLTERIYMDMSQLSSTAADLANEQFRVSGIHATGPVFWEDKNRYGATQDNTELFVAIEYWIDGTPNDFQYLQVLKYRHNWSDPEWLSLWTNAGRGIEVYGPHKVPPRCDFVTTRSNTSDPDVMGAVVVCWAFYGYMKQYPDETNPSADTVVTLPGDTSQSGGLISCVNVVAHQGRVVGFPLSIVYAGTRALWVGNENFFWSSVNDLRTLDPALAGKLYWVNAGWENPTGYQVMASLTADELLLIKSRGGAIVMRGSLNDFSAINYPYVKSTGYSINKGTVTPVGYAYPVENSGIWLWGGGQVSDHLTKQFLPGFWEPPVVAPEGSDKTVSFLRWPTSCTNWSEFALFPNNWLWDTDGGGWWRIADPDDMVIHHWAADWRDKLAYGSPAGFRDASEPVAYVWDYAQAESSFNWQSQPLPGSMDRVMEVRELALVGVGKGEVDVRAYTSEQPEGQTVTFRVDGTNLRPTVQRQPLRVTGTFLTFEITSRADNTDEAAPEVHELRYGVQPRQRIGRDIT